MRGMQIQEALDLSHRFLLIEAALIKALSFGNL